MGRSSARGELLNFLQTAYLWREKAECLQSVCIQTVSESSEMLVRAKPNISTYSDTHQARAQCESARSGLAVWSVVVYLCVLDWHRACVFTYNVTELEVLIGNILNNEVYSPGTVLFLPSSGLHNLSFSESCTSLSQIYILLTQHTWGSLSAFCIF